MVSCAVPYRAPTLRAPEMLPSTSAWTWRQVVAGVLLGALVVTVMTVASRFRSTTVVIVHNRDLAGTSNWSLPAGGTTLRADERQ